MDTLQRLFLQFLKYHFNLAISSGHEISKPEKKSEEKKSEEKKSTEILDNIVQKEDIKIEQQKIELNLEGLKNRWSLILDKMTEPNVRVIAKSAKLTKFENNILYIELAFAFAIFFILLEIRIKISNFFDSILLDL